MRNTVRSLIRSCLYLLIISQNDLNRRMRCLNTGSTYRPQLKNAEDKSHLNIYQYNEGIFLHRLAHFSFYPRIFLRTVFRQRLSILCAPVADINEQLLSYIAVFSLLLKPNRQTVEQVSPTTCLKILILPISKNHR